MKLMNRRIATLAIAAAFAFGSLCPSASLAKDRDGGRWMESLTTEQQDAAKKIFSENAAQREELKKAERAKREELETILKSENPDKGKIETLSREIGELRGKSLIMRVDTRAKLKEAGIPVKDFDRKFSKDRKDRKEKKGNREHWDREGKNAEKQ